MKNSKNLLATGETAEKLGVTPQTLRNWEKEGRFLPDVISEGRHRYYNASSINRALTDLQIVAMEWAQAEIPTEPSNHFYCQNSALFQARLQRFEGELMRIPKFKNNYSIITAIAGEIGNNSFDHNVGNWPDVLGIFFGYDLIHERIVLADRGRGILKSLQRVRPELEEHAQALQTAFTEILTGRAPEHRGNGLKFVRNQVIAYGMALSFQSGDAVLTLKKPNLRIVIKSAPKSIQGCLAVLQF